MSVTGTDDYDFPEITHPTRATYCIGLFTIVHCQKQSFAQEITPKTLMYTIIPAT